MNIQAAATAINMSAAAVQALAADTYAMVVELRQRLYSRKQMMWLNGVDNASPVPLISDQVSDAVKWSGQHVPATRSTPSPVL